MFWVLGKDLCVNIALFQWQSNPGRGSSKELYFQYTIPAGVQIEDAHASVI